MFLPFIIVFMFTCAASGCGSAAKKTKLTRTKTVRLDIIFMRTLENFFWKDRKDKNEPTSISLRAVYLTRTAGLVGGAESTSRSVPLKMSRYSKIKCSILGFCLFLHVIDIEQQMLQR